MKLKVLKPLYPPQPCRECQFFNRSLSRLLWKRWVFVLGYWACAYFGTATIFLLIAYVRWEVTAAVLVAAACIALLFSFLMIGDIFTDFYRRRHPEDGDEWKHRA